MQKSIFFVLFLSSGVCFSQSITNGNKNDSSIIGAWVYSEKELFGKQVKRVDTVIFYSNRTYKKILFGRYGNPSKGIYTGNWNIVGMDSIKWKETNWTDDKGKSFMKRKRILFSKTKSETFQKFEIDGNILKLYWDHRIFTYNRVKMN